MAIVDVVKWNASDQLYAWKFPSEELSTWTQVIVAESQEAVFVKEGKMLGPLRAGHHVLDTKNYPILSKFVNIAFGARSPFTAEVWFVNHAIPLDVKWGTPEPIQLQDPKYNIVVPVRAFGQFGVQIVDSKKFLHKLVGTMHSFDREKMVSYFRGLMLTRVKNAIADTIVRDGISILEISTHLNVLSERLLAVIKPELEEYGIELKSFFVNSVNVPENDPAVAKLKAALAKRAEMDIIGYSYQQERTFNSMESASANPGGGAAVMNAGIGLAVGAGVGDAVGSSLRANIAESMPAQPARPSQPGQSASTTVLPCPKCGQTNPDHAKYCLHCGLPMTGKITQCPACQTPGTGKFCIECGSAMRGKCPHCGSESPGAGKFCTDCGSPLASTEKGE